MASTLDPLRAALRAFMAGGPYMPLWEATNNATALIDEAKDVTDADRAWFDSLHELVHMGQEDPVTADEHELGLRGSAELRSQIQVLGLDRHVAPA
jgi:hypothetical protein